jgi:hypothetical protein
VSTGWQDAGRVGGAAAAGGDAALAQVAGEGGVAVVERGASAERVDRAAASHGQQPAGRVLGHPLPGPVHEGLGQRLLGEVLGQRDVAGVAGEGPDDPGGLDAPHRGDGVTPGRVGHVRST